MAPTVISLDINGSWKATKYVIMDGGDKNEAEDLLTKRISFNSGLAAIGHNYLGNPRYKLKVVNRRDFLANEYKWTENIFSDNKDVEITSVSDDNNVFCDFIKLDNNSGLLIYKNVLYNLTKTDDSTLGQWDVGVNVKSEDSIANLNKNYNDPIGVLIGLKSSREKLSTGQYGPAEYRTLWVSFKDDKLSEPKEIKDLLVPRMNGFWTIKVNYTENKGYLDEEFEVTQVNEKEQVSKVRAMSLGYDLYRDISFVGNDYIATQYYKGNNFKNNYFADQILPVDNTKTLKGVDINTLLGEEAQKSFYKAWNNQVGNLSNEAKEKLNVGTPNFENYTMIRKNGHWVIQGKISAIDQDNFNGASFNINYPPTKKLVNHDKLFVSWNSIKVVVPAAVDAYTAYNGRLVFIVTKDKIDIYQIRNGSIVTNSIGTINLKDNESVVMCEWVVTGQSVDKWDKEVNLIKENEKKP
ncbi:lipoprotein [Clostridium zeae]|uniref:Lipoprotein n=1 Tax=Clostridium zeae TaxID=2759022 RepID=A0ABQ1E9C3_9CLOT|nr:lipoprotein [Clostridium zeae]